MQFCFDQNPYGQIVLTGKSRSNYPPGCQNTSLKAQFRVLVKAPVQLHFLPLDGFNDLCQFDTNVSGNGSSENWAIVKIH